MTSPSERNASINVTPLIDILLVLLIIFMVILPQSSHGLDAGLPQDAPASFARPEPMIVVEITRDHQLLLNGQVVMRAGLEFEISQVYKNRADRQIFIRAGSDLEYREVAALMDDLKGGKSELQIGLLSQR